jgi:predicted dehydrogenase
MMRKVGLIGAGKIGAQHMMAIGELKGRACLKAIADTNVQAGSALANICGARHYSDYHEMLRGEELDIVAVCLPHNLHVQVGLEVLGAGVHLFVEKPMALTTDDCRRMIEAASQKGKVICVGHSHQYQACFRKARETIDKGVIGEVRMIMDEISAYYNFEKRASWWLDAKQAGGGPLFNTTPHQIDHLLYLVDGRVSCVRACVQNLRAGLEIDSDEFACIEFANGCQTFVGTFSGTRLDEPARLSCRVFGSKGSLSVASFAKEIIWAHDNQRETVACANEPDELLVEWRELLDALDDKRSPRTDGIYGHNVVAVLEAMVHSAQQRKEVVPSWLSR